MSHISCRQLFSTGAKIVLAESYQCITVIVELKKWTVILFVWRGLFLCIIHVIIT